MLIQIMGLALQAASQTATRAESQEMTTAGWLFLIIAWAAISSVTIWTFSIILRKK